MDSLPIRGREANASLAAGAMTGQARRRPTAENVHDRDRRCRTPDTADGTYPTTCWECSTCCGALATVRDGRVVDFAPNRDNPYSKGAFCIKGIRGAPGITYRPNRLLHPMRRTGARGEGKWARVSWDEALDEMADRLAQVRQKHGPEAIVGATSGAYFSRSLILALTLRSIGSPNWMINQDLCGGCRAVSARVMGLNITRGEDIDNTRCALIVGRNPSIADPVEWAALKAAKKRGARIIVIDPKRTPAAQMADLWLAPQDRHRRGARAGHDPGADRRGALRQGVRRALVPRLRAAGRAGRAISAELPQRSPACRPSRSSPPRACTPTGRPPSSAATASMPSAPACRRSAPTTASSPSAAMSIGPAATCACARRAASRATSISCTCRSSGSTPRPSSAPSAPTASRCGPAPRAGRRPATTPPSSTPC